MKDSLLTEHSMSGSLATVTALATGLASVGALLAYPLASPPSNMVVAESMQQKLAVRPRGLLGRFFDWIHRRRTMAELADLDDRLLRDIGLTRGVLHSESFRASPRRSFLSEFDFPELRRH
jgi:uncharacterized protein YjiS (DUF1127 family)